MTQTEERIYNEQGELLEIKIHEFAVPSQEELISEKEAQLLAIYQELQNLKNQ
jgi:hypothetical protein